jgi:hypothetical protein
MFDLQSEIDEPSILFESLSCFSGPMPNQGCQYNPAEAPLRHETVCLPVILGSSSEYQTRPTD